MNFKSVKLFPEDPSPRQSLVAGTGVPLTKWSIKHKEKEAKHGYCGYMTHTHTSSNIKKSIVY